MESAAYPAPRLQGADDSYQRHTMASGRSYSFSTDRIHESALLMLSQVLNREMMNCVWIGLGSAIGGICRYGLSGGVARSGRLPRSEPC